MTEAAGKLAVSRDTLARILRGTSGVSAEMAIRLGLALGTSPELWAGLQSKFDLHQASKRRRPKIARIVRALKDQPVQDLKGVPPPPPGATTSIEDTRSWADEDLLWDCMVPIGREFGSPDYERLSGVAGSSVAASFWLRTLEVLVVAFSADARDLTWRFSPAISERWAVVALRSGYKLLVIEEGLSALRFSETHGNVPYASPEQTYVDLMCGNGRAPDAAKFLREQVLKF